MRQENPDIFVLNERFTDFEKFAQMTRAWDLDFVQLDRGNFETEIIQIGVGEAQLARARFNRFMDQKGSPPPGLWTFAMLTAKSSPITWRGRRVSNKSLMIYPAGSEIDAQSRPGFDVYTLSYSERSLDELTQMFGIPTFRKLIGGTDLILTNASELSEFQTQIKRILVMIRNWPLKARTQAVQREIKVALCQQLISILVNSCSEYEKPSFRRRDRALQRAKEYLKEYAEEPITVRDLHRATGVSERTLRYAFLEHFGVSPKTYLMAKRLNCVRRHLYQADPSSITIVDVANHWGFWHMGQFAADYKRLFGELPSETLAR